MALLVYYFMKVFCFLWPNTIFLCLGLLVETSLFHSYLEVISLSINLKLSVFCAKVSN